MRSIKTLSGFLFSIILLVIAFSACDKNGVHSSCFDKKLYEQYKDRACTADCPGVTGCDGKKYCNACVAAQEGIRAQ